MINKGGAVMAKETMKAKVERLDRENKQLLDQRKADIDAFLALNNEITKMQATADQEFANSPTKKQFEDQIDFQSKKIIVQEKRLNQEIQKNEALRDEIERLEAQISDLKVQKVESYPKIHNERNAGRKAKIDEKTIAHIQMYRAQGLTIKKITELVGLSYGSVQKIVKN